MKRITTLATVAAVALVAMAALSAASASAGTVLCKATVTTCAQTDIQPAGTTLNTGALFAETFTIKGGGSTWLSCSGNLMSAKSGMRNGNPLPAEFKGALTPSECAGKGSTSCSSSGMNTPPATLEATGSGTGKIKIGSAAQPLVVSFTCKFAGADMACTYTATNTVTLTVDAKENATASAPVNKTSGSGFCGVNSTLTVTNFLIGTHPSISSATETVLCKETGWSVCPNDKIAPVGTYLTTAANLEGQGIKLSRPGTPEFLRCVTKSTPTSGLAFNTTQEAGAPLPTGSFTNVDGSSCTYLGSPGTCTSVAFNTPSATIEYTGLNKGIVKIGTAAQPLTLTYSCTFAGGVASNCSYAATGPVSMEVNAAGMGTAVVKSAPVKQIGASCYPNFTEVTLDISSMLWNEVGVSTV